MVIGGYKGTDYKHGGSWWGKAWADITTGLMFGPPSLNNLRAINGWKETLGLYQGEREKPSLRQVERRISEARMSSQVVCQRWLPR